MRYLSPLPHVREMWPPPYISLYLPTSPHLPISQVREMWGYCIAAASLGIKHRVMDALQYEGGS